MKNKINLMLLLVILIFAGCNKNSDTTSILLETNLDNNTNITTHSSKFVISGKVTNNSQLKEILLEENSEIKTITTDQSGSFSITMNLKAGPNNYKISAIDTNNNTSQLSGNIYLGNTTAAGNSHSAAIYNGNLYTWGRNNYGQTGLGYISSLSDNTQGEHPINPTKIFLPTTNKIVALSFNQNFSIALDEYGNLWSWGYNANGELGRGPSTDICNSSSDINDCILNIGQIEGLSNIVNISAGYSHSLALKNDGTVYAFGSNSNGELGNGTTDITTNISQVIFEEDTDIIQVSAGSDFSCALDSNGKVWAWGKNNNGQLGQGLSSKDNQLLPTKIAFPNGVKIISIATGKAHALALDENGTVYGWGLNASSQVGYNGYQYEDTEQAWENYVLSPKVIIETSEDNKVQNIYANGNSSYILKADKKIYPWGQYGETNEEGKTIYANLDFPEDKLSAISSIKELSAGALHLVAVKDDGTIFTWRWSFEGSLGGGDSTVNAWMYNYPIIPEFSE